jgi:hypothetical protein
MENMKPEDGMSSWLKLEIKLFAGALTGYIAIAAITGTLTVGVLAVRAGMAIATALLIGIAYQGLSNRRRAVDAGLGETSSKRIEDRQRRLLMWSMIAVVVAAFVVGRLT